MRGHASRRRARRAAAVATPPSPPPPPPPPAQAPLRAVANRGFAPVLATPTASGTEKLHTRARIFFGPGGATEVRVVGVGWYQPNNGATANMPNAYLQRASLELVDGSIQPFTFGGAGEGVVNPGDAEAVSDALYPAAFGLAGFPPNTAAWLRYEVEAPAGSAIPTAGNGASPAIAGENALRGGATSPSRMLTPGALAGGGGWSGVTTRCFPAVIVGRTATPQVSVLRLGDSIAQGQGDGIGDGYNGAGGFVARGLAGVGQACLPTASLAHGGERAQRLALATAKERGLFRYFTHVICNYGINDLVSGGRTPAQVQADLRSLAAYAKSIGVAVWDQVGITPYTSSPSTNWLSDADQTPAAGFEAGGAKRDALNALLAGGAGVDFDALIPAHAAAQSGTAADRWVSDGTNDRATADGLHPSAYAHGLMAAAVTARAAGYAAPAGG